MRKIFLALIISTFLFSCKNSNSVDETKNNTIKDDKLAGFLLAGVYFFNGYGGAESVFEMAKSGVNSEINTTDFMDELDKSYSTFIIFPFSSDQQNDSKETLEEYWEITDKNTFMETLDYLKKSGHHDEFVIYKKMIDDNGGANADLTIIEAYKKDEEIKEKLAFIKANYNNISATGIKAWDYARYVNNVCLGYSAGYITRNEGEKLIRDLLEIVRNKYNNWADYYKDYNMGRKYWGGDKAHDEEYDKTVKEMMEGDYSIYKYLPLK